MRTPGVGGKGGGAEAEGREAGHRWGGRAAVLRKPSFTASAVEEKGDRGWLSFVFPFQFLWGVLHLLGIVLGEVKGSYNEPFTDRSRPGSECGLEPDNLLSPSRFADGPE